MTLIPFRRTYLTTLPRWDDVSMTSAMCAQDLVLVINLPREISAFDVIPAVMIFLTARLETSLTTVKEKRGSHKSVSFSFDSGRMVTSLEIPCVVSSTT